MAREPRRLAAIVSADVAGYSRLMGADEAGTLKAWRAHRAELIDPAIAGHGGRIVKTMGDGLLVEFASVVAAAQCAIDIQSGMAARNGAVPETSRQILRIGINLGDIVIDGEDIHGDGVNIAARLQALAEPGGIALSAAAREQIGGRIVAHFEDGGEQALKNIARPVRVWRWVPNSGAVAATASDRRAPALPDRPSIAVLPFTNMGGDSEQEYFADGITEDIITALSKFSGLFVIARNSSFAYKGKSPDIRQVGRELGVRYVLEGSVRKAGNRVRITGQLIEAQGGGHIWADRIDGPLDDIFDLQDKVTESIVGALGPKLESAEIERASRKPTDNLDAFDLVLRGRASLLQFTRAGIEEALALFMRAIALDPGYATAYGWAAHCYNLLKAGGWVADPAKETEAANRLARRVWELDKDDAVALGVAGYTLAHVVRDLDAGAHYIERALTLNPNLALNWSTSGWIHNWLGNTEISLEHFQRAMRLSPLDPQIGMLQNGMAHVHFQAGRYEEAIIWALAHLRSRIDHPPGLRLMAAAQAMLGRNDEAGATCARLLVRVPDFRTSALAQIVGPYRNLDMVARYVEGLRLAGVPD